MENAIRIGNQLDRICNLEFRPQGHAHSYTSELYEAARKAQDDLPLTYLAATKLKERLRPGDTVFVVTGTGIDKWCPAGESDGPIGCAALAKALVRAFDVRIVASCEAEMAGALKATILAAGEPVLDYPIFKEKERNACTIEVFPLGKEAGKRKAKEMVEKYKPAAAIFVERLGPNEAGIYHFSTGTVSTPDEMSYGHFLLDELARQRVLTIGIGDGGNEIGFGKIVDDVRRIVDFGNMCKCPCRLGTATVSETDVLVSTSVSNWGAYGIAAMLALLMDDPLIQHDEETEYRMEEACARHGCIDGLYLKPILSVDGISVKGNQAIVTLMREIINIGSQYFEREF